MRKASPSATGPAQTGLTPGLKRLITNAKRFGAVNLWQALTPDERMAAATSYLADEADARKRLNWSCPAMTDTFPLGPTKEVSHGGKKTRAVSARVQGADRRACEGRS